MQSNTYVEKFSSTKEGKPIKDKKRTKEAKAASIRKRKARRDSYV